MDNQLPAHQILPEAAAAENPAVPEVLSEGNGENPAVLTADIRPSSLAVDMDLKVKLLAYEGPLELLLDLIKKNEMNIYDIPIAEITHQYLEAVKQMKQMNLDTAGEFLVMAATLLYIKSKMLLPVEDNNQDDDSGEDPREELVRKLLEYQAFKEVAGELGFLEGERSKVFQREISDYIFKDLQEDTGELDAFSNNLYDLMQAFYKVLKSAAKESYHDVFEQVVTIEEKVMDIKRALESRRKMRFMELFSSGVGKFEIVVTFIALLEVVRQRVARVAQEEVFGDIIIESAGQLNS